MKPLKATLVVGKQNVEDMIRIQEVVDGQGNYSRTGYISIVKRG